MIARLSAYNQLGLHVDVTLIGLGSIGTPLLTQLTYLQRALDQTSGRQLTVTAIDNRVITAREMERAYLPAHLLGQPLAAALVSRVNLACGLNWRGQTQLRSGGAASTPGYGPKRMHVVISAVDSAAERLEISRLLRQTVSAELWLDLGHQGQQGQAVLGWTAPAWKTAGSAPDRPLPTVDALLGSALKAAAEEQAADAGHGAGADTDATDERCADLLAVLGARLLWSALQPEHLTHHAYFVDLAQGAVNSQRVPPLPPPPAKAKPKRATKRAAGKGKTPRGRQAPAATA